MFRTAWRVWRQGTSRAARAGGLPGSKFRPVLEMLETRELLSFAAPVSYNVGTQADPFVPNAAPVNVVAADFNGNGKLDLAVAHTADNSVSILLNNGNGTFQAALPDAVGETIQGNLRVGDFNGDGKLDLFLPGGANQAIVLLGKGNGTFQPRLDSSSFSVAGTYPRGWAVGDFNGDGKLDVAATLPSTSTDSGGYTVLLGNGNGTFAAGLSGPMVLHYARWVTTGDFNHDGKLDLATADGLGQGTQTDTAELTILLGNGDGTFNLAGHFPSPETGNEDETVNPEDVVAADLNQDGNLDVIVSNYSHNINVFLGNGDGTFQPASGVDTGEYPRSVVVADVNGDGKMDLVATGVGINVGGALFATEGAEPGTVAVLLGNGDGTFQSPVQYQPFAYPGWTAVGDFNGDGSPDLAVTRVFDGHSVNVMFNQPASTNRPPTVSTAASATPNPVSGTTTNLSVLGSDDGGEANLTYTWATLPTPPASVAFSANGTNAAKNTTATFTRTGTYDLEVTITDAAGLSAISIVTVTVTVNPTVTSITVSPASASVAINATQQFIATARDQSGTALATQPTFTWTVTGGGTISSTGLYTAPASGSGAATVHATSGGLSGTAEVTVLTPQEKFVRALYTDFLGRPGAVAEFDRWVAVLPALGQTGVAYGISHSREAFTRLVKSWYVNLLGRPSEPSDSESLGWVNFLVGGATAEGAIAGLLGSPEFARRANTLIGGANPADNLVRALYLLLLRRPAGAGEVNSWLNALTFETPSQVVAGFFSSIELRSAAVRTFYGDPSLTPLPFLPFYPNLLRRTAPPGALDVSGWTNAPVDLLDVEVGFAASTEFFANG